MFREDFSLSAFKRGVSGSRWLMSIYYSDASFKLWSSLITLMCSVFCLEIWFNWLARLL